MKEKNIRHLLQQRTANAKHLPFLLLLVFIWLLSGCKKEELAPATESESMAAMSRVQKKKVMVVSPDESIQASVNAASAGTVIKIQPGTYREAIVIDKPGITLIGEGRVVVQNPGDATIGIMVKKGGDDFSLKHIIVEGFTDRGVEITEIDGFSLWQVTATNNGEFGLFAQYSRNGAIEHCEATGHTDTGIFVGESTDVTVLQNKTHGNTIGIETENASYITIDKNHAYDNTAGILCLLVPHAKVVESTNIAITKNQVRSNNLPNLQTGSGELETFLPQGIGILLVGVNNTLVQDNHVTDNQYTGIAVVSTAILKLIDPGYPLAGIEPDPDNVSVIGNQVKNNGYDPQAVYLPPLPGVDLLWLGPAIGAPGTGNCWSKNLYGSSFPAVLPTCP